MARIVKLERQIKERHSLHDPVEVCTYDVYEVNGDTLLQVDTGGRAKRQMKNKTSQSFQVDEDGARELLTVIREAFPRLR